MTRVLVCGGRDYTDRARVDQVLTQAFIGEGMTVLAHGGATGADALAGEWAAREQLDYRVYPARWRLEGKAAGPRRNLRMLNDFKPDLVIAFPGGRGTAHMVSIARDYGVEIFEVRALPRGRPVGDRQRRAGRSHVAVRRDHHQRDQRNTTGAAMSESMTNFHRAEDAQERDEGICRTCLAPIWNEGGTINHRRRDEGWSDRIERGGDSLVCFKAVNYRHVPLTDREACIYDRAFARGRDSRA